MSTEAQRRSNTKYKAGLIARGLCARCPSPPALKKNGEPGRYCEKHVLSNREQGKKWRRAHVPPPVHCRVWKCQNPPALPLYACETHLEKSRLKAERRSLRMRPTPPAQILVVVPPSRWRPRCACGKVAMTGHSACWCCDVEARVSHVERRWARNGG